MRKLIKNNGFSLLEISIVLALVAISLSVVVPNFVRGIKQIAAQKTALEISQIQEASRKYYIDHGSWPVDFVTLAAGYLDPVWSATNLNPFQHPYIITVAAPNLVVQTDIDTDVIQVAAANLQMVNLIGNPAQTIQSSVTPPGSLSTLAVGSIIEWPSTVLPSGFLWCNGQSVDTTTYSGLFAVIGYTFGGSGSNFNLPDRRGRVGVGVDSMGGSSAANRITLWNTLPSILGGTFGEDAHRQTVAQMAPHHHGYMATPWTGSRYDGHSSPLMTSQQHDNTEDTGGNGDGSGLGAPSNVVQPSIAMGYIIKT